MKYVPKAQATRAKIDRWDLMKPQTFCAAKEATERVERQATEWEKIFAKHMSGKGLICKTYKELLQLSSHEKTKQNENTPRYLNLNMGKVLR